MVQQKSMLIKNKYCLPAYFGRFRYLKPNLNDTHNSLKWSIDYILKRWVMYVLPR